MYKNNISQPTQPNDAHRQQYLRELEHRLREDSFFETFVYDVCDCNSRHYIKVEYLIPSPNKFHSEYSKSLNIYSTWNTLPNDLKLVKDFTKQAEQELDQINMQNVRISG